MTVEVNKATPVTPKTDSKDKVTDSKDKVTDSKDKVTDSKDKVETTKVETKEVENCCDVTIKATFHTNAGHQDRDLTLDELRALLK